MISAVWIVSTSTTRSEVPTPTTRRERSRPHTHMTEWYFGKAFVASMTAKAKRDSKKTGMTEFRFWQDGTGYLTIQLH